MVIQQVPYRLSPQDVTNLERVLQRRLPTQRVPRRDELEMIWQAAVLLFGNTHTFARAPRTLSPDQVLDIQRCLNGSSMASLDPVQINFLYNHALWPVLAAAADTVRDNTSPPAAPFPTSETATTVDRIIGAIESAATEALEPLAGRERVEALGIFMRAHRDEVRRLLTAEPPAVPEPAPAVLASTGEYKPVAPETREPGPRQETRSILAEPSLGGSEQSDEGSENSASRDRSLLAEAVVGELEFCRISILDRLASGAEAAAMVRDTAARIAALLDSAQEPSPSVRDKRILQYIRSAREGMRRDMGRRWTDGAERTMTQLYHAVAGALAGGSVARRRFSTDESHFSTGPATAAALRAETDRHALRVTKSSAADTTPPTPPALDEIQRRFESAASTPVLVAPPRTELAGSPAEAACRIVLSHFETLRVALTETATAGDWVLEQLGIVRGALLSHLREELSGVPTPTSALVEMVEAAQGRLETHLGSLWSSGHQRIMVSLADEIRATAPPPLALAAVLAAVDKAERFAMPHLSEKATALMEDVFENVRNDIRRAAVADLPSNPTQEPSPMDQSRPVECHPASDPAVCPQDIDIELVGMVADVNSLLLSSGHRDPVLAALDTRSTRIRTLAAALAGAPAGSAEAASADAAHTLTTEARTEERAQFLSILEEERRRVVAGITEHGGIVGWGHNRETTEMMRAAYVTDLADRVRCRLGGDLSPDARRERAAEGDRRRAAHGAQAVQNEPTLDEPSGGETPSWGNLTAAAGHLRSDVIRSRRELADLLESPDGMGDQRFRTAVSAAGQLLGRQVSLTTRLLRAYHEALGPASAPPRQEGRHASPPSGQAPASPPDLVAWPRLAEPTLVSCWEGGGLVTGLEVWRGRSGRTYSVVALPADAEGVIALGRALDCACVVLRLSLATGTEGPTRRVVEAVAVAQDDSHSAAADVARSALAAVQTSSDRTYLGFIDLGEEDARSAAAVRIDLAPLAD